MSNRRSPLHASVRLRALVGGATALTALLAGSALIALPASAAGCAETVAGDLNGDGFADAVVTEYGRSRLAGAIHVLYGTAKGLTADPSGSAPDDQVLHKDTP